MGTFAYKTADINLVKSFSQPCTHARAWDKLIPFAPTPTRDQRRHLSGTLLFLAGFG